jgi:hypothetical protein
MYDLLELCLNAKPLKNDQKLANITTISQDISEKSGPKNDHFLVQKVVKMSPKIMQNISFLCIILLH